jgi:hypothetical protein
MQMELFLGHHIGEDIGLYQILLNFGKDEAAGYTIDYCILKKI